MFKNISTRVRVSTLLIQLKFLLKSRVKPEVPHYFQQLTKLMVLLNIKYFEHPYFKLIKNI